MEQKQESPRFILILGSLFLLAYVAFNLGTAWMDSVADKVAAAYTATPTAYMTPTVSPTNVPLRWITPTPTPGGLKPSARPPISEGEYPAPETPTSGDENPALSTPSGGDYPPPAAATPIPVTPTPEAIQPTPTPTNLATATNIPSATPTTSGNGYPGPGDSTAYPGPGSTATPRPTSTATTESGEETQPTQTQTPTPTQFVIPTNLPSTPSIRKTPGATITELDYSEKLIISNGSVNQAIWSQNQAIIGLATSNGIFIYDSVDLESKGSFDLGSSMASVTFVSTENWIAAGGNDASIQVWDLADDSFVMDLPGHLLGVVRLVSSDIGNYLVSGGDDATVRIWDTSGNLLFTFSDPETRVTDLMISSDLQMVVASSNRHVHIWNPVTGMLLRTISQPVGWYQAVALSPDNFRLVTAYEDRRLEFWDTITWTRTQFLPQSQRILYLDFSPDGSMLAGAYDDGSIKIWDPQSLALLVDISGHSDITSMAFNPFGDQLLTSSADGTIRLWDLSPLLISD